MQAEFHLPSPPFQMVRGSDQPTSKEIKGFRDSRKALAKTLDRVIASGRMLRKKVPKNRYGESRLNA
jgi:hypothetical protein